MTGYGRQMAGRLTGARLLIGSLGRDMDREYAWLRYCAPHFVPDTDGFIVQGIWDRWPPVSPAIRQAEYLLELLEIEPGQHLLDIGSGLGGFAEICLERVPALGSYTGVDINPEHVAAARRRNAGRDRAAFELVADGGLRAAVGDRAPEGGFDRIVLNEVSQDLQAADFAALLESCCDLLADDGRIVLIALSIERPPENLRERLVGEMVVRSGAPARADIRRALEGRGLAVEETDLTAICSRALAQRAVEDPHVVAGLVPWPLSTVLRRVVGAGVAMSDRGAYAATAIVARAPVSPERRRFQRAPAAREAAEPR